MALSAKWSLAFTGPLAATPAVVAGTIYLAGRSGALSAFDATTGAIRWSRQMSTHTGIAADITRATPAVGSGRVIVGYQPPPGTHDGAPI